ncbi:MAG TPA: DNA adenine methylase [Kofleriaceae bacterium]
MGIYFGGKNHLYRAIINLVPRHERFVELFGGSAAVARNLERSGAEAIVIERDPQQVRWLKARRELAGHRVVGGDAFEVLAKQGKTWGPETVVLADPPYPIEDRRDARARYRFELEVRDHASLLGLLVKLRARVLVCGQPWGMYSQFFAAARWKRHEFRVGLRSGNAGVECVWTNFADPFPLHDYRYFGADKRLRQDLRRRIARQRQIFHAMDRHHRAAILRELAAAFGPL